MKADLGLYSDRALLPSGLQPATILIRDGRIIGVYEGRLTDLSCPINDVGTNVIMPSLIDAHVHINEPGRTDWEGFVTATQAAAASGITLLVDMPLNSSPVSTSTASLQQKLAATKNKLQVDCAFWGGLIPGMEQNLAPLLKSGVLGIKAFLTHSGIDEFPNVEAADLHYAMPMIAQQELPLLVHCELDGPHAQMHLLAKHPQSYAAYLQSRPKNWENEAIEWMIRLCRQYSCRVHIVHLSSAEALPAIRTAKTEGLPLTVETCPHYLYFHAEAISDGQTQFKCAPPIRELENQLALWEALEEGLIDFIATDHSPAPPDLKELTSGNFAKAWGGIAGLQFLLPAFWTAAKKRGIGIEQISQWTASNVAQFLNLDQQKGKIAVGYDADLVVWNPEADFYVTKSMILHKHKVSPYLGDQLYGQVLQTYLAGKPIYQDGQFSKAQGKTILKK